jgi:predicted type IV restriction endonuclease
MTITFAAESLDLIDVEKYFNLEYQENYLEWLENLSELEESEIKQLDRIKSNFAYLSKQPMLEEIVKMVVVSPLLDIAGFYQSPFHTSAEKSVRLSIPDKEIVVKGKIDIFVIQEQLWVLVIETKRSRFSLEPAIPQALAYMVANPQDRHCYGLVTNGSNFIFIKLDKGVYSFSEEFTIMRRENELYKVLQILKSIAKELQTNMIASTNGKLIES